MNNLLVHSRSDFKLSMYTNIGAKKTPDIIIILYDEKKADKLKE